MKSQLPGRKKANPYRAKKLVKSLLANNLNEAATGRDLGITRQAVHEQVNENPLVKAELKIYLDKMDAAEVNDDLSVQVLKDALKAEFVVTAQHEGEITDEKHYVDHAIRLKANEQYLKIKKLVTQDSPKNPEQHLHLHLGDKKTQEILTELGSQIAALIPKNADN